MSEWGNPPRRTAAVPPPESIGRKERTRGSETSQYPQEKKTTSDSRSSGERNGNSPNRRHASGAGVVGPRKHLERCTTERDSRVRENGAGPSGVPKYGGTRAILPESARTIW